MSNLANDKGLFDHEMRLGQTGQTQSNNHNNSLLLHTLLRYLMKITSDLP